MIPVLYHTVVLDTAALATRFRVSLALESPKSMVSLRVRALWMSPASDRMGSEFRYGVGHSQMIIEILRMCSQLRTFTLINFKNSYTWSQVEDAIPKTLVSLTLGPTHAPLDMRTLAHVQTLTSINTFIWDNRKLQSIVTCPNLRHFCRILPSTLVKYVIDQLPLMCQSATTKKMEILITVPVEEHKRRILGIPEVNKAADGGIVFTFKQSNDGSWIEWLLHDFISNNKIGG